MKTARRCININLRAMYKQYAHAGRGTAYGNACTQRMAGSDNAAMRPRYVRRMKEATRDKSIERCHEARRQHIYMLIAVDIS